MIESLSTVIAHSRVERVAVPGSKHWICPRCDNANIVVSTRNTTLLAGGNGTEDGDPNHRIQGCRCQECNLDFDRHAKYQNVWYVNHDTSVILRGVATCFENFHYPCTCGGIIRRRYTKLDGITQANALGWSPDTGKTYRVRWTCDACTFDVETSDDYVNIPRDDEAPR